MMLGPRASVARAAAWTSGPALALMVAFAVLAGCSPRKIVGPNTPPETVLFVQGPVDTVNHVVHFYWFGSDPDGEVLGFEWRLLYPGGAADPPWAFTTRTDSTFEVQAPAGFVELGFQVRAVDNSGLRDPTPARHDSLKFRNRPPTVTILDRPTLANRDSTFTSITLRWSATDPEGDAVRFRVWVNGNEAGGSLTPLTTFTVPSESFCRDGYYYSEPRTVFVQPIDNGGMAGPVDSTTWYVRAPSGSVWPCDRRARLLIVDDEPTVAGTGVIVDTMFRNPASRLLAAALGTSAPDTAFSILRLTSRSFRSPQQMEQTFKLFRAVVWYRDAQTSVSAILRDNQDAIGAYLDGGGKFFLEGIYLVEGGPDVRGALSLDFVRRYLGSSDLDRDGSDGRPAWGNSTGTRLNSTPLEDSLSFAGAIPSASGDYPGIRTFAVVDTNNVCFWAAENALAPPVPRRLAIGVSVPQANGGRAVLVSFAMRAANPGGNTFRNVHRVLEKIYVRLLGVTDPVL